MALTAGQLADRHAVVTGGGRGIGRAIAAALTRAGANVTVVGRNRAALQAAVEVGDAAGFQAGDVADQPGIAAAIAAAERARGPVAILVNNAGTAISAPFLKTADAIFRDLFDVHVMGAVHTTRAVLPGMIERGHGRIVNVASTAGLRGSAYISAYCAAKHALIGLTRALAVETAKTGVTVNAVCPGYTDTELVRDSIAATAERTGRSADAILASYVAGNPQGRLIHPEEVAAAVAFLCQPEAAAMTGLALPIAGGEL